MKIDGFYLEYERNLDRKYFKYESLIFIVAISHGCLEVVFRKIEPNFG